jgi:hypothetical protein
MLEAERWNGYFYNIGHELLQMKEMLEICEDATIKVRRLVRNFEDMIEFTENDVWDSNRNLR